METKKLDELSLSHLLSGFEKVSFWRLFLPIYYYDKKNKIFLFQLFNCAVVHIPLTKKHGFDLLEKAYRKWWHLKYVGFEIWFPK